ncbi:hypothetical protein AVEN_122071-1 [Araneus ventricosus]|uniref:Uncharacterized protein n=1 Tax=Araneus ventricosus TaxID=182803 RepID=A0A4Y2LXQ2_ARAVE|nr:hypothetical protein AVEN_122071-1 [Araneus ventricosus]
MAYMPLNNVYPNFYAVLVEPTRRYSIERDPVFLLIEEIINYSLRYHNLHDWIPPVNLDVARSMNVFTYFNENFAATVINRDTEEQAMWLANRLGFNEGRWLDFIDHEEARQYQEYYLLNLYYYNRPFLFQMFSFACYASRIALQRNRHSLINDVVWALLATLRQILPNEEYYREIYFVANLYNNQHIDNQPHDADEGLGGIVDEDNSSSGNERSVSLVRVDPILLFVEELIDYSLRFDDLHGWIPPIDLGTLRGTEMRYFTENLGRAITHSSTEEHAVHAAQQRGFNEERWLELCIPSEARNFQNYFLRQVFHFNDATVMLSFACYSSKLAMRRNRNSLVNEVVSALVHFLRQYYPHRQHYREFDDWASEYNVFLLANSDDDGLGSEDDD